MFVFHLSHLQACTVSAPITPLVSPELISLGLSSSGYTGVSGETVIICTKIYSVPLTTMDPLLKCIVFPLRLFIYLVQMDGEGPAG